VGGHFPVPNDLAAPGDCPGPSYAPAGGATAVISVGALTPSNDVWANSSIGPTVWDTDNPHGTTDYHDYPWPPGLVRPDLAAPGDLVTSCAGTGGYVVYSGTSMSCPLVAGAAAILLQAEPDLTPAQLAATLEATAVDIVASPAEPGRDNRTGAGLIDLPGALDAVPNRGVAEFWICNDGEVPLLIGQVLDNVPWLEVTVASTLVAPRDSVTATAVFDPATTLPGAHSGLVLVVSNDPDGPHLLPVHLDWGAGVSAVREETAPPAAPAPALANHPNPFNPRTTLRFTVTAPGRVVLDIYDLRGRRVRRLLDAQLAAGARTAVWDGRDEGGREVGSGVYLARLQEARREPVTRKLMLVR
jgi:hypothetical protein